MKRITHLSIQNHGGVSITPFGVILSALAECESQDLTLYEKALHIDNALAVFVRSGYEIKFCSDEDAMLIFEHPSDKK
jgi:hypothetical protein